jgi:hypothetical protein
MSIKRKQKAKIFLYFYYYYFYMIFEKNNEFCFGFDSNFQFFLKSDFRKSICEIIKIIENRDFHKEEFIRFPRKINIHENQKNLIINYLSQKCYLSVLHIRNHLIITFRNKNKSFRLIGKGKIKREKIKSISKLLINDFGINFWQINQVKYLNAKKWFNNIGFT